MTYIWNFQHFNVDFDGLTFDHLGSTSPPYGVIKFGYPVQNVRISTTVLAHLMSISSDFLLDSCGTAMLSMMAIRSCLLQLVELYSYTEESEFFTNKKCFDETSLAFCEFARHLSFDVVYCWRLIAEHLWQTLIGFRVNCHPSVFLVVLAGRWTGHRNSWLDCKLREKSASFSLPPGIGHCACICVFSVDFILFDYFWSRLCIVLQELTWMLCSLVVCLVCVCSVGDERWTSLSVDRRRCHVMHLIDMTEVSDRESRMKAVRSLLYLCQGQSASAPLSSLPVILILVPYFGFCAKHLSLSMPWSLSG